MNIRDLEEFSGLTADHVRTYLERTWWTREQRVDSVEKWVHPSRKTVLIPTLDIQWAVIGIASVHGLSPQAILREMNPRMVKGPPSMELIAAHGGHWLAMKQVGSDSRIMNMWDRRQIEHFVTGGYKLADWSFWPCDAHGNKVPYPKVAK